MATSARPSKAARKGPPEPSAARRTSAWGNNARSSPTYSSAGAPPRQQQPQQQQAQTTAPAPAAPQGQPAFPPLAQNQNQSPAPPTSSSPAPAAPRDRVLQALSGLTGTTVTILTKTGQRFEGVVGSTTATEGDTTGVTLKDAKDVSAPGAPLKDSLFVAATNIESYTSGPADARPTNGDTFRTDTDISAHKTHPRERDLQAWVPASTDPSAPLDEDTFSLGLGGPNANGTTSWDQFTVNEQLFGVKGSFDENVYTTKLDRSAPDFKEREKRAMRIASEIMGSAANNPHVAEERGLVVDDSGANEEDKYGAVVRGQNAYVPPGARRQQAAAAGGGANAANASSGVTAGANAPDANAIPKVAVNGPDGSSVPASNGTSKAQSPPSSKAASPSPVGVPSASGATKPPADALPAFRDFVKDEKQRLTEKRQALQRGEREKRLADLKSWSQMFKLNKPIPDDLVPILAKDEEKQRLIREKAMQDAADAKAKAIAASTPTTSSRGIGVPGVVAGQAKGVTGGKPVSSSSQAIAGKPVTGAGNGPTASTSQKTLATSGSNTASNSASATPTQKPLSSGGASGSGGSGSGGSGSGSGSGGKNLKISMFIPPIPPFKGGNKAKMGAGVAGGQGVPGTSAGGGGGAGSASPANKNAANGVNTNVAKAPSPASPAGGGNANAANNARLNVNASSFRPNPKASAFSPLTANSPKPGANGALPPSNSVSPKPKSDSTPATPNPFFGTRPIKKSAPVHVKDDFNPFKHNKVVDASQVAAIWPYSGKRYMQMFPQPAHPPAPHPAHMVPPAGVVPGPPMPPPSYEEDSAAQQAAAAVAVGQQPPQHRGYVYAYPQYGYPPQMMPGMPPPGPPGAYMPGPYMQPMPYPPGMPPPNAMYSPAMGQMPPPQAYMQPPPPGAYPPPPNGAGPRPSMPPTPIPAHAHPYYHQSPQLQHAYPMMMPPPPPNMAPPHGYEGAPAPPPVPMQGGHA
ncbi:hypothetical protein CVT26_014918 [Gymnopilus dilepis]|uniref:LsmAD domain-containing protein n=1 Tax=Gymnopilus dilepis TaxID=231916 RepID=A0A409XWT6_9AGAR|nr:hypothetical protein CVT26_014918 [Gymnopilus dilepis]